MKCKIFSAIAVVLFISSNLNANTENLNNDDPNDPDCQGNCYCDAIVIYHSYMFVTKGNREIAVENAIYFLEQCENGFPD